MGRRREYPYPGVPAEPGYYVYELWAEDACLYVGRVGNNGPGSMRRRLNGHRSSQPWWPEVARIIVTTFAGHEEIVAAEARRISELRPLHNRHLMTGVPWVPNVVDRQDAYQAQYRLQPERKAREQQRAQGRDWAEFNIRAADRKRRWAASRSRRPSAGQAAMF